MAARAAVREPSSDVNNGTNLIYMLLLLNGLIIYSFSRSNKIISVEYLLTKAGVSMMTKYFILVCHRLQD
jgi:hypothetical protein